VRWGTKVAGWRRLRPPERASVVAFNPGVLYRTLSVTPYEDFTAGEIDQPERMLFRRLTAGKADGAQARVLTFLEER
jgi:hypothetical protein